MSFRYCTNRRSFPFALLILFLCAFALSAISCRQVGDVAGVVSLEKSDVGQCIKICNQKAKDQMKAEQDVHKVNIFLCHKSQGCQKTENERHAAAVQRIEAGRLACIQECHHQGGASGGR